MTSERWQQVKRILEETLEHDSEARAAYLTSACAGDDALRRDVESFLAPEPGDGFLDHPAVTRPPAIPDAAVESPVSRAAGPINEVSPVELAPYTKLVISTRTSRYELVVVAPLDLEVAVKGGRRFPTSTRAHLYRQDSIRVGGELALLVGTRKVVTTSIERIEIQD